MKRVLFLLANLIALAVMTNAQPVIPADLILINGRIYTVDSVFSTCESLAIKDGRFLATGTSAEISEKYRSDRVVDAHGLPVYPGFIDGHCHFYGYALSLRQTDLKGARSFQEVLTRLQDYARNNPSGWIVGRGWDHNLWEKKIFPDRRELDIIFPDRPVVLIRIDGHVVLANGEAMKRAGIGDDKMFLPGEVEIREGRMTGILSENASDRMRNCIPPPDPDQLASLLRKAQQNCFGQGLTGVCDAGLEREEVTTIDSLQRIGSLSMKIYAMLSPSEENLSRFIEKGIHKTSRLNIRSVKLYADGSLGSRTALLKNPYSDDPGKTGIRVTSADSLRTICSYALKYGYQVNTHAIGDSAVKLTLEIYEEFLGGRNDLRWRIEHAQVVDPADLSLFGRCSVIPSVQTTHATSDMYWAGERLGSERLKGAYAYRELLGQNGWLINGTDFPIEGISPVLTFYAAVSRKDINGFPPGGFQVENALSREQALRSITIWPAKGTFEEKEKGSIEPGKAADFVILDKDIMLVPESELPGVGVQQVFLDGVRVY
jgi:predicted amidohydrolase YtcJ